VSIFNGMAGALNSVFGAPVTITPQGGSATTVTGIFRIASQEVDLGEGRTRMVDVPTIRLRAGALGGIAAKAIVAPSITPGRTFRALDRSLNSSPANDAMQVWLLEEIT